MQGSDQVDSEYMDGSEAPRHAPVRNVIITQDLDLPCGKDEEEEEDAGVTLSTRAMEGEEGGVGRHAAVVASPPSDAVAGWGGLVEEGDDRELSDFDAKLALLSRGVAGKVG